MRPQHENTRWVNVRLAADEAAAKPFASQDSRANGYNRLVRMFTAHAVHPLDELYADIIPGEQRRLPIRTSMER